MKKISDNDARLLVKLLHAKNWELTKLEENETNQAEKDRLENQMIANEQLVERLLADEIGFSQKAEIELALKSGLAMCGELGSFGQSQKKVFESALERLKGG